MTKFPPFFLLTFASIACFSQVNSSNLKYPSQNGLQNKEEKLSYTSETNKNHQIYSHWRTGGGIGVAFGSNRYFEIQVNPSLGYQFNNQIETGITTGYTYTSDNYAKQNIFNIGPYLNYYPIQNLFLRVNYLYYTGEMKLTWSDYKKYTTSYNIDESALWLGAGYQTSGTVRFQIGWLYNVLYDKDKSIFNSAWQPFAGVSIHL